MTTDKEFSRKLCLMKLSAPTVLPQITSSIASLLLKEAATRWQKELASGALGAVEKARLKIPEALGNVLDNRTIQKVRGRLWRPTTDLNAAQLAAHRQMRGL